MKKLKNIFISTTFAKNNSKISDVLSICKRENISNIELGSNHAYENNFKKIIKDFYTIFSEKEKLNPGNGWKDAFEESFNISVEDFYKEFDAFMLQDRDSQISIIKSTDAWENASWN